MQSAVFYKSELFSFTSYNLLSIKYIIFKINVIKAVKAQLIKNIEKYLWFLLPTQVPTQGQWWSWISIQELHWLQWKDLGGLRILQVLQNANSITGLEA